MAREVARHQDVLALMPAVIERESDTAAEVLDSRLADALPAHTGANAVLELRPRPRPPVLVKERSAGS